VLLDFECGWISHPGAATLDWFILRADGRCGSLEGCGALLRAGTHRNWFSGEPSCRATEDGEVCGLRPRVTEQDLKALRLSGGQITG
jgi:hypothetical protein